MPQSNNFAHHVSERQKLSDLVSSSNPSMQARVE